MHGSYFQHFTIALIVTLLPCSASTTLWWSCKAAYCSPAAILARSSDREARIPVKSFDFKMPSISNNVNDDKGGSRGVSSNTPIAIDAMRMAYVALSCSVGRQGKSLALHSVHFAYGNVHG